MRRRDTLSGNLRAYDLDCNISPHPLLYLADEIPATLGQLGNLKQLRLSWNKLSGE